MFSPASSHWHSILHESNLEFSVILLALLLFTASEGRLIVNDPNSHFHQPLEWPKSETWTWQPQPLHHGIDLVLSATLNPSIKNLKDPPPILFIVIQKLHYSPVHTFKHKLSFMITFIPFFRQTVHQ